VFILMLGMALALATWGLLRLCERLAVAP
jgi:hypothetical protein